MELVKLRALHRYSYGTRSLNPGDVFEAGDEDAQFIVGMEHAERVAPEELPGESKPEQTTEQEGGNESAPEAPKPPKKPRAKRGGYLRRDERAQD